MHKSCYHHYNAEKHFSNIPISLKNIFIKLYRYKLSKEVFSHSTLEKSHKLPLILFVLKYHMALRIECETFLEDESFSCLCHAMLHLLIQPAGSRNVPLYSRADGSTVLMLTFVKQLVGKMGSFLTKYELNK